MSFDRMVGASLAHRFFTICAAAVLLGAGGWVAATSPVDVFPDLTAPTVTVLTDAHGLASEEVESLVTFPIETAVNGAAGVRRVRSSSAQGISIVWVDFDWGTDIFRARQTVTERLQPVASQLPDDVSAPVLAPVTSIMGEILLVGMSAPEDRLMEARTAADWVVRPRLLAVPGVAQVVTMGGHVRQYQVMVDPERLLAYDVGLDEVLTAAAASNRNASGGVYRSGGRQVLIRGLGRARDAEEIGMTVVAVRDGVPVLIDDLADVRIGSKVRFGTAAVNAEPAVMLSIQKQPGTNTLDLTRRIDAELDEIEAALPEGVAFERDIFRQADFIALAVDNVITALRDGAVLVVAILFLFLWNARTTVISVLAIPLSLALAVIVLRAVGGTINTMTLGGMAIAIGALVDDAIIFVENAHRRLRENSRRPETRRRSSVAVIRDAAREIMNPILSATVIITIVFVPLFFLSGVEGRMLRPLGLAYVVSILASLLVAVTVTPALCHALLTQDRAVGSVATPWLLRGLERGYRSVLEWALHRTGVVLTATALLLAGTLALIPGLGRAFLPEFQEGSLTISVVSLPGTSLAESDEIGARVERQLLGHPAVASTSRRTGRAELDEHAQGANASEIDAQLDLSNDELADVMAALRAQMQGLPGTNVTVGQPIGHRIDHMLSGTRAAIAVNVFGPDLQRLSREIAGEIEAIAQGVAGLVDIAVEQQADVPQLLVRANRPAMARHGVTPGALTQAVDVAFQGEEVSLVREGAARLRSRRAVRREPPGEPRGDRPHPDDHPDRDDGPAFAACRHRAGAGAQRDQPRERAAKDRDQRQCGRTGRRERGCRAAGGGGGRRQPPRRVLRAVRRPVRERPGGYAQDHHPVAVFDRRHLPHHVPHLQERAHGSAAHGQPPPRAGRRRAGRSHHRRHRERGDPGRLHHPVSASPCATAFCSSAATATCAAPASRWRQAFGAARWSASARS